MKIVNIKLNSIEKVNTFVNIVSQFEYEFDLISGTHSINAKSIMGIFILDLSDTLELRIHSDSDCEDLLTLLEPYIVN